MKRLLVTGASGFIGRHIVARALSSGQVEVHGASRTPPGDIDPAVRWHAVDLRDGQAAAELVHRVQPDLLIHAAWIATPGVYAHSPENLDWVRASLAIAEAFGATGGRRFVGVGSSAEYGENAGPVTEDGASVDPASVYGKAKLSAWWGIRAIAQHHDVSAAWARIFLPYGPGDPPQRLIPSLLRAMSEGVPIPTTEGQQLRDFIVSVDVADMLCRLAFVDEPGVFNIGTGVASSVRSVMERVGSAMGRGDLLQFGARPMARGETMCLVADMTKTGRALGGIAPTPLDQGLGQAVAAWRQA